MLTSLFSPRAQKAQTRFRKVIERLAIAALTAASWQASLAQTGPTTILEIDTANRVQYVGDIADVSKLAIDPNVTTPVPSRNFVPLVIIADIVAVNGQPAKGTSVFITGRLTSGRLPIGEAI